MPNPLSALWTGTATISEYQDTVDPNTFQTTQSLVTVTTNEPCRLSFKSEPTTGEQSGAPTLSQFTILFIRPNLTIDAGSVISVTQNGVTTQYKRSSKPAVYTNHQEIALELYEGNP